MTRKELAAWCRACVADGDITADSGSPLGMLAAIAAYLDPPPEMRERQVNALLRTTAERQSPLAHGEAVSALAAADEVEP